MRENREEQIMEPLQISQFGVGNSKGKKNAYDLSNVMTTAGNLAGNAINNIGNMLNGSMQPNHAGGTSVSAAQF